MRARAIAIGIALAIASIVAAPDAIAARWVIPPGQDAIAMRMLGGELPAGCKFLGASIEKAQIVARYACSMGEARLVLRHPEDAPNAVARSKQLAIVAGDAQPEALVAAIAARMRAEEASWRWIVEGRSLGRSLEAAGLSPRARRLVAPLGIAAALGFAALVAIATWVARRFGARASEAVARRETPKALLGSALVVAVVFAYLEVGYPAAPVHADTTRDLLMAMDCLAGQPCDHGPPTTLGVIVQGALWTRFLAASRALGASVAVTQAAVFALHAIAVMVLWRALDRRFGRGVAIAAAALFAAGSAAILDVPILWNPSISVLPLAVFHALVFALAEGDTGGPRSAALAALAAFSLALAMDCHVLFVVLAPPLFAAITALARRPVAALAAAAGALVVTLIVDSRSAWAINARAISDAGAALPLAALAASAIGAGLWARPRLREIEPKARALVFIGAAAASATGMTALLFAALGPAAGRRYAIPAAPGLALGIAAILAYLVRRLAITPMAIVASSLAICAALRISAPRIGGEGGFTIREMEVAAREVYRLLPSHREVAARVHGRSSEEIAALAIFEPRGGAGAAPHDEGRASEEWLLLRRPRGAPSLVKVSPRLDRSRMTFCFAPRIGASEEQGCVEARLGREPAGPATPEERAYPALAAVRDAFPPELLGRFEGGVRQTIRVPLDAGEGALVALMAARSGYRIEGAPEGTRARLDERAGEVVLVREDGGEPRADRYWPPEVWEVPAGDAALVAMVEEAMGAR